MARRREQARGPGGRPRVARDGRPDAAEREDLERAKRASVGQLLFRCARMFDEQAIAIARTHPALAGLRRAHTSLFPHIDLQGTRLTEIARRLGVTKQAAGQLVDELVAMGALERVPDPADARAKLVCFSRRGGRLGLLEGLELLGGLERDVAAALGPTQFETLHRLLLRLMAILDARAEAG
jgi:DNA-binding MarR family transcriptional regulator